MVRADDVLDGIHQVSIAQARSADCAMEDFCKEMEWGKQLQDRLHDKMHKMVESLWDDTDNLQEYMSKVMALAWANKSTPAKTLQRMTSLEATAAALVTAVNNLISVVWHQGALMQNM
jgi:hypothetical protein